MNTLTLVSLRDLALVEPGHVRLFIARQPIKDMPRYGLHHVTALAPSGKLLGDFKGGRIDWPTYVDRFRAEMILDQAKRAALARVHRTLERAPVALVCFCGGVQCHRFILGHYFEELGVPVRRLGGE